jgi:hypothetical protein
MTIENKDQLNKALHDMRAEMKANGASIEKIETLTKVLKDGMETIRRDASLQTIERERSNLPASEAEVVSAYYERSAESGMEHLVARTPRDLGYDGSAQRGQAKFIGSGDSGIVRLLGGDDASIGYEYGLLDDPEPKSAWQAKLQQLADDRSIVRSLGKASPKLDRAIKRHLARGPEQIRKVFADNPGEGGEFIPDIVSPILYRTAELNRVVEALFPTMNLTTGGITKNPFHVRGTMMFLHGVPQAGELNPGDLPKSVPVTADRSVEPVDFVGVIPADLSASEDSIVAWAPYARLNLAEAARDSFEDAIINGDLPVHQDAIATWNPRNRWQTNLLGTSKDHRLGFVGLRARAADVSGTVDLGASQTIKAYAQNLAKMTVAHALDDVVWLVNYEHFLLKMLTDDDVRTLDKMGPQATQFSGQLGQAYGRPIILSEFLTPDLESTGLYTDGSGGKAQILPVNRSRFVVPVRRGLSIGTETVLRQHTSYLVGSMRKTFRTFDDGATKNVLAYNNLDTQ